MLYDVLSRIIARGAVAGLQTKLDVFFAADRLSEMEYQALASQLAEGGE